MVKLLILLSMLYYKPDTLTSIQDVVEYYKPKRGYTGIILLDRQGNEVFSYNADTYFTPASLNKTLISSAFLYFLGPSYTFKTPILRDPVSGNLYFLASGDPSFKVKDLFEIFSFVKSAGITSFDTLYLVDWAYDSVIYGAGWQLNDVTKGYMPPISSFILENNVVKITALNRTGLYGKIVMCPQTKFVKAYRRNGNNYKIYDAIRGDTVIVVFEGNTGKEVLTTRSILVPEKFFQEQVDSVVKALSIRVKSICILKDLPILKFDTLYVYDSKPAYVLLLDFMKYSLNIYGEAFLKTLGREVYGGKGTYEKGLAAVDSLLRVVGLCDHFKPADGSGLSRYNLATPRGIGELLYFNYRDFRRFPEFASLLPISGIDGTLSSNYKNLEGVFRGKTGTLTGVSTVGGYIRSKSGEDYIYVIMLNNTTGSPKYFMEKILEFVYERM
ncbi:MAG TPA: D-alanyl-D-alanine carboxypeptidase/D-alanyl-D-alanine-endopeptidase [Candidatus Hydrothermia bacterium]|mgnify:CR=1 FL=1|nr:D-alanyl-D-alanine carboxypeptidase/D-alanyl-D-alanine-endopeptidase [Candidatus Hydrothermia bacterium]